MTDWTMGTVFYPVIGSMVGAALFWVVYKKLYDIRPLKKLERDNKTFHIEDGVTLFDNDYSESCRCVRIALLHKKISFKRINVDLITGEQYSEEFLLLSPTAQVPVLCIRNVKDIPDCVLYDSSAIIEFIGAVFPGVSLYPDDPWQQTEVRMWQEWETAIRQDYEAIFYQNFLGFLLRLTFRCAAALKATTHNHIPTDVETKYLRCCEGRYKSSGELEYHAFSLYKSIMELERKLAGKDFLTGDKISAADIVVFPRIRMLPTIGLPIMEDTFPNLARYIQRLESISAFAESEEQSTKRLKQVVLKWERLFVVMSNIWSGSKQARFNGRHALSRALDMYKEAPEEETSSNVRTLRDLPLSVECWQATLLMIEKEMPFQLKHGDVLDLLGKPCGSQRAPCLLDENGSIVTGRLSILEYIDRTGSGQQFHASNALKKAQIQCWQSWEYTMYVQDLAPLLESRILSKNLVERFKEDIDSLMQLEHDPSHADQFPAIMQCFLTGMKRTGHDVTDMLTKYTISGTVQSLEEEEYQFQTKSAATLERIQYLESILKTRSYLVGDEITMADMCVFCRLQILPLLDIEISCDKYPCVSKWISKLTERPGFFAIAAAAKLAK